MEDMLYKDKYVAFIDMLGFSSLVRESAAEPSKLFAVSEAINRLKDTACDNPAIDKLITYFSDCLVISADRTPAGLVGILSSIKMIAENLLAVDIFVRGGLAAGNMFHDKQFMFGPAMLDAYNMECKEAKYPSILVGDDVYTDVIENSLGQWVFHDSDEPHRHYVHYLISFAMYDPTPRSGLMILDGPAQLVRHFIAMRLRHNDAGVRIKAEWIERYWNDTVGAAGFLGRVDREADLVRPNAFGFRTRQYIVG